MQTRRTSGFVLKIIIFSAILVMALTFLCISSVITSSQYGPRADAMSRQNAPQELKVGVSLPHAMIYPPKGLLFDAKRLIFAKPGDTLDIKVAPNPVGAVLPEARLTSTNEKIVRVEPSGKVTSVGWGECRILAKAGDFTAEIPVAVASKWVALTFDDGPKATVKPFLEELKRRSVRATFFVLGQLAETKTGKEALTQMARDGHEIGNHSYDHTGDPKALAKQIVRTNNIVRSITGRDTTSLRPPYGKLSETTKNSGDLVVLWSIDSLDWKTRNTDAIVSKVLKNVKSGDIVLMHDIYETTTAAASRIITDLRKKGFTFVTVSEILQEKTPGKAYASGTKEVRTLKVPWE